MMKSTCLYSNKTGCKLPPTRPPRLSHDTLGGGVRERLRTRGGREKDRDGRKRGQEKHRISTVQRTGLRQRERKSVCACVRACRACVRVCVRVCVCVCEREREGEVSVTLSNVANKGLLVPLITQNQLSNRVSKRAKKA